MEANLLIRFTRFGSIWNRIFTMVPDLGEAQLIRMSENVRPEDVPGYFSRLKRSWDATDCGFHSRRFLFCARDASGIYAGHR